MLCCAVQGLEQAGDTIVPEIILEPSLAAALEVAARPLGTQAAVRARPRLLRPHA